MKLNAISTGFEGGKSGQEHTKIRKNPRNPHKIRKKSANPDPKLEDFKSEKISYAFLRRDTPLVKVYPNHRNFPVKAYPNSRIFRPKTTQNWCTSPSYPPPVKYPPPRVAFVFYILLLIHGEVWNVKAMNLRTGSGCFRVYKWTSSTQSKLVTSSDRFHH